VRIDETFEIAAPQETVYNRMNNVGDVGYCIAGVKRVEVIDERESNWKIEQRFGFMARTFDLKAQIKELEPPRRIAFAAAGQDVEVNGQIAFTAVEPSLTRCELEIEVDVVGALAPLVEVFAKGPQQQLVRETVANLRAALEGEGPPEAPAAEPKASPGWLARIRAWFGARRSDSPA
jgi:carbon monoxide dehydrogenase subunit G